MKILRPLGNEISKEVKNWKQIKEMAIELHEFVIKNEFEGHYGKVPHAIAHCQVSIEPMNFFILSDEKAKKFGHWCIVNMKIIKKKRLKQHNEACMSFMFRKPKWIDRYLEVTVTYQTPFLNLFLISRKRKFEDIDAFICQHEVDHANGINVYGL